MNKAVKVGIIVGVIAVGIGLASPLFYETQVDEPLPVALDKIEKGLTYEKFASMDDQTRQPLIEKMSDDVKDMIMDEASLTVRTVSEGMAEMNTENTDIQILKTGTFEGLVGHSAEGTAKIILVGATPYLRFEDFEVTNGPDLRVYMTIDGNVKDGIHIAKLREAKVIKITL